jgi:tetratricopeptide (TPR) repeat protein
MIEETKSAPSPHDSLIEQVERRLAGASLLAQRGEYRAAIAAFEMALELLPDYADTYLAIGIAYEQLNEWNCALEYYNRAIELDPTGEKSPQQRFADVVYFGRGNLRAKIGDFSGAIEDFTWRIQNRPEDARAYVERGSCYYHLQNYQLALSDFTTAIQLDPQPEVYFNRGITYFEYVHSLSDSPSRQELQKVIDDYSKAIQLKPDDPMFHYKRGTCYVLADHVIEGKQDLLLATQLSSAQGEDALHQKASSMLEMLN